MDSALEKDGTQLQNLAHARLSLLLNNDNIA